MRGIRSGVIMVSVFMKAESATFAMIAEMAAMKRSSDVQTKVCKKLSLYN